MKLQKVFSVVAITAGAALVLGTSKIIASNVIPGNGTASTPISAGGVTPYIIPGANNGGNRTCSEVGLEYFNDADYYAFETARVNYNGSFSENFPNGLTVTTNGTSVSFNSTFSIGAAIVKGSNDANVYVYQPEEMSDSGLASPVNASGGSAGLSNLTFCWNNTTQPSPSPSPEVSPSPSPEVSPSPSPAPSVTPSPSPSPSPSSNDDKKDDEKKSSNTSNAVGGIVETQGQVLGATTYAETGVVADTLMSLVGIGGAALTTAGSLLHAKKTKK